MRVYPVTDESVLAFSSQQLGDYLTSPEIGTLEPVPGARNVSYLNSGDDQFVLRCERPQDDPNLPRDLDSLRRHAGEWYEGELEKLQNHDIGILPHNTWVIEDEPHRYPGLAIYMLVPRVPKPQVLFNPHSENFACLSPDRQASVRNLQKSLLGYYWGVGLSGKPFIGDIQTPRQYLHLSNDGDDSRGTLHDYDQLKLSGSKRLKQTLGLIESWTSKI